MAIQPIRLFGDPVPLRDVGLLNAAAARPQTTVFGADAYATIWDKAAALLDSIVNNHPLIDGNKRLGWTACAVFLELNGASVVDASNDDVVELVTSIAAGRRSIENVATALRSLAR